MSNFEDWTGQTIGTSEDFWTNNTPEGRNRRQRCGFLHPLTCGNNRTDEAHKAYQAAHPDEDFGQLIAAEDGWICPVCNYTQPL